MSFISYAQNFEDVMLWRALRHVEGGFYIDIGAWSPDVDSVTRAFYERGWHGLNVEPNPELLEQLSERRPRDINLGFAVSDHSGHGKIAILDNSGLSTLDESLAEVYTQSGYCTEEYREIELTTLRQIHETHLPAGQSVHFLKVDVEGLEQQVIQGNDWTNCRPWVVVVEATRPMSQVESYTEWETILEEADYRFCYADGLNRFYVVAEHAELISALHYPPNVFDDFISYSTWAAERSAEDARERVEQLSDELKEAQQSQKGVIAGLRTAKAKNKALSGELARAQRKMDELHSQAQHWWNVADAVSNELNAVYRSNSWRVT